MEDLEGFAVERMPAELWSEATEWARRFGASAVGRALGIGYLGLRQRLAEGADTKARPEILGGGFVELGTWAGGGVLRVEADRGDGCRMRLEVAPGKGEDAAALLRAFSGSCVQKNHALVEENPEEWLPRNYQQTLANLEA